ncbi:PE-PGRS family protein [Streptomyces sp. NPDC002073]
MADFRLRDHESYEAMLAGMGLEPLGTWWLPGIRKAATARRLLAAATDAEPAAAPAEAARLVLGGGREFLLAFGGPHAPRGSLRESWRRVRIRATDPVAALAALLTAPDPDPRCLLLASPDGDTMAGTTPGRGAARVTGADSAPAGTLTVAPDGDTTAGTAPGRGPVPVTGADHASPGSRSAVADGGSVAGAVAGGSRLLVLGGVGARIDRAAEDAARESVEEGAAAWARLLDAAADPGRAVLGAWAENLAPHPGLPQDVRRDLLLRFPELTGQLPPAEFVAAVLALPDSEARLRAVEWKPGLTPAQWTRLIRAADTERERWLLTHIAAGRRIMLAEEDCALLAGDPSPRVRAEAVGLSGLPERHAVALAEDPDPDVRAGACRVAWPVLPAARREALLADEAPRVRTEALLRHHEDRPLSREAFAREALPERVIETCRLAPDLVRHLLATGDARRRAALAGNPRLDPATVARLGEDSDDGVRRAVSVRADLTEEQRSAVRADIDPSVMSHTLPWVEDLHEDPDAMRRLAASSHLLVRRSVARARRLPPDVVHRLARDPDHVVQLFLAESCEDAPAEMLLRVWTWWTGSLSSPGRPRTHPNFPREGLLRYAEDLHGRMRRLALDDPQAPAELVARFARDRDPEVRYRAAEDPRLPVADAARLAEDPDDSVRAVVLRNRHLPASVLAARLCDPESAVEAVRNPGIPPYVLRAMAAACRALPA